MPKHNNKYINDLLTNNREGVKAIYKEYLPKVESILRSMGATKNDSWEIFQDSLIVVMQKAQSPDFELNSSFYTFLVAICKFKWFNESKKKYKDNVTTDSLMTLKVDEDIEETIYEEEKYRLFRDKMSELGDDCRKLLQLFFAKKSLREIAQICNMQSENAAKQKKYKCQKKLIDLIKKDSRFEELY